MGIQASLALALSLFLSRAMDSETEGSVGRLREAGSWKAWREAKQSRVASVRAGRRQR